MTFISDSDDRTDVISQISFVRTTDNDDIDSYYLLSHDYLVAKNIINSDIINKIKKNNLITTIYSEKNFIPSEAKELWSMGVQSIFIDDPSEFKIS